MVQIDPCFRSGADVGVRSIPRLFGREDTPRELAPVPRVPGAKGLRDGGVTRQAVSTNDAARALQSVQTVGESLRMKGGERLWGSWPEAIKEQRK